MDRRPLSTSEPLKKIGDLGNFSRNSVFSKGFKVLRIDPFSQVGSVFETMYFRYLPKNDKTPFNPSSPPPPPLGPSWCVPNLRKSG